MLRSLPSSWFRLARRRSTSRWFASSTERRLGERRAAMATDSASFGSFLLERPVPSTRTLEARVAGTSRTRSSARTSCWDNR